MLRTLLSLILFVSLVPAPHAFELISAEIVPGTSLLYRSEGLTAIREAEYLTTGPQNHLRLLDLNIERGDIDIGPFGPFEPINGSLAMDLPSGWTFFSEPGRISSLSSQIVFDTYRIRLRGEPIAYLPVPPSSQSSPAPPEIALDVVGYWSLGDLVTPFSVTFVGEPLGNGQTRDTGVRLSGLLGTPLPPMFVDGALYEPEVWATVTIILTPEPGTALLLGVGLVGLAVWRPRR